MAFDIRIAHVLMGSSASIHFVVFLAKKRWGRYEFSLIASSSMVALQCAFPNHSLTIPLLQPVTPTDTYLLDTINQTYYVGM